VNNVAGSPGVRGADDIFVIDQGSRPRGDEFRLSGGPISAGFFYYDLRPDDDGSTRWELYESGTNWQAIDALGAVMTGLQNIWHAGVSAWHQRMGDLASLAVVPQLTPAADFPGGPTLPRMRGGLWMRGFGENADYDPPSAADFHQSIAATQGGVDGIAQGPLGGDSVIAGLLGAYVHSDLDLEHMPDRVVYEGGSIGGYLTYLNGGFHADLLVKADLLTVTYQQRALSGEFDARSIGGSVELGYKFDIGEGFYLNPLGQLAYVASDIDDGWLAETVPISFACAAAPVFVPAIAQPWRTPRSSPISTRISSMNFPAAIAVRSSAISVPGTSWTAGAPSVAASRSLLPGSLPSPPFNPSSATRSTASPARVDCAGAFRP
jgi:outer membrane autotransporter protein